MPSNTTCVCFFFESQSDGLSLSIYQYLQRSVTESLKCPSSDPYPCIQLLLVLSEISQTAQPPLCFSVFQLTQQLLDRLSLLLTQPFSVTSLGDFQTLLDLLQILYRFPFSLK